MRALSHGTSHEHVTRTNDGEVGLTGPALSLLKGKPPHWYYAASAWAASHQRGAKRKFLGSSSEC